MVFFAGAARRRRQGHARRPSVRRQPGTFYSGMSNIDIEIGDGNPGAVGVRGTLRAALLPGPHGFPHRLRPGRHPRGRQRDARTSTSMAASTASGPRKPSPGWQFTVVDASFEGQREAAIREREAGLTLIRPHFRNVPTAIAIDAGVPRRALGEGRPHGRHHRSRRRSSAWSNSARTEINIENVVCRRVPVFAAFRESGKKSGRARRDLRGQDVFSHGLNFADIGAVRRDRRHLRSRAAHRHAGSRGVRPPRPAARAIPGSTSARWAPRATASPTTPRPSARPSPRIAPSTCPPASTSSATPSRSSPTPC